MSIRKCAFSPTSENPGGYSVWCILAVCSAHSHNIRDDESVELAKQTIHRTVGKH